MVYKDRRLIHIDLDAFFASVEELLNPEIAGQPIIVGGGPGRRGVVASASYAARAYGIRSAMPTAQALRLCPQAILIPGDPERYSEISDQVMALLKEYTPLIEKVSIDEAFLDVTGCERLWGPAEEIARTIQRRVKEELGLPSSLGVAANKLLAKMASEEGKPGGLVVVPPGQEAAFLAPLPVERLWGVGPATAQRLHALGVEAIGELAHLPLDLLEKEFGALGRVLYRRARGRDDSLLTPCREPKSIGHEHTFARDLTTLGEVQRYLLDLCERVGRRLRGHRMRGRTITVKLRHSDFTTLTRSATLPHPTDLDQVIYDQSVQILRREWQPGMRLRLVGVSISNLTPRLPSQLDLFDQREAKLSRLNRAVDEIRERYGDGALQRASLQGSKEPLWNQMNAPRGPRRDPLSP
ncbi:MAG: DNA polymerase IV [Anaerolineae bacterium]